MDKQRVRVAAGLIDKLQQATVPKQAAGAGATFLEKGKTGNWSLHQGHRRGAARRRKDLPATKQPLVKETVFAALHLNLLLRWETREMN